jgi:hypothetical protein
MRVYDVESVLSFNTADFRRYGDVRTIHPASMLV